MKEKRKAFKDLGRPHRLWLLIVVLAVFLARPQPLWAHMLIQGSTLDVAIHRDRINVVASITPDEIAIMRNGPSSPADDPTRILAEYSAYLLSHLHVTVASSELQGKVLRAVWPTDHRQRPWCEMEYRSSKPGDLWAPGPGLARVEITQNLLADKPDLGSFLAAILYAVRIAPDGQPAAEGLLLSASEPIVFEFTWAPPAAPAAAQSASEPAAPTVLASAPPHWASGVFLSYLRHGIHHILTGYDHLLFISALVLAAASLWDLIKVVSVFTLAHTVTLCLSALNVVRLPPEIVEPFIAGSIVFVAVQNVFWPQRSRGNVRLLAAFLFGLFHGLGFAGGLLDAMQGMSGHLALLAILAFSLGVELGHQLIVVPLFGLLTLCRRWEARRPTAPLRSARALRYGSGVIALAGVFYFAAALRLIQF